MRRMGIVKIDIAVENLHKRGKRAEVQNVMVDTGSELTWIPRKILARLEIRPSWKQHFVVADGRRLEREVGYAMFHAAGTSAVDHVVFGEPTDMTVLGSRTLEGLNVKVDVVRKRLVPAGPIIAGAAA